MRCCGVRVRARGVIGDVDDAIHLGDVLGQHGLDALAQRDVRYPVYFFFQAEDGIRDRTVTGVQTCALPISVSLVVAEVGSEVIVTCGGGGEKLIRPAPFRETGTGWFISPSGWMITNAHLVSPEIGRASCRERGEIWVVAVG